VDKPDEDGHLDREKVVVLMLGLTGLIPAKPHPF